MSRKRVHSASSQSCEWKKPCFWYFSIPQCIILEMNCEKEKGANLMHCGKEKHTSFYCLSFQQCTMLKINIFHGHFEDQYVMEDFFLNHPERKGVFMNISPDMFSYMWFYVSDKYIVKWCQCHVINKYKCYLYFCLIKLQNTQNDH